MNSTSTSSLEHDDKIEMKNTLKNSNVNFEKLLVISDLLIC